MIAQGSGEHEQRTIGVATPFCASAEWQLVGQQNCPLSDIQDMEGTGKTVAPTPTAQGHRGQLSALYVDRYSEVHK